MCVVCVCVCVCVCLFGGGGGGDGAGASWLQSLLRRRTQAATTSVSLASCLDYHQAFVLLNELELFVARILVKPGLYFVSGIGLKQTTSF